ncbi:transposase [Calothrix sp. NIES-4071]|nr:transposase [Calothrix sp. NIES-4071]BAZ59594.1 transposase [Calothrix sp. NIES-4105]
MSPHARQCKSSKSQKKHSETGTSPEKYVQLELPLITEDTISTAFLTQKHLKNEQPISIAESVPINNETTLIDKQIISSPCSQEDVSSKKSEVDSTTIELVYKPFWDKYCLEMSNKLYAVIRTDSQDSESKSSTTSVEKTIQNSWFSIGLICLLSENSSRTFWQLSTSSVLNYTDLENINKKSKKIRIYPETNLKLVYRKWLAACRWCYNQAIAYLRDCFIKGEKQPSKYDLRNIILKSCPDWVEECPYSPREEAIFDAKTAFSKTASKNKSNPSFKSCREPVKSLKIGAKYWGAFPNGKRDNQIVAGFTHYPTIKASINGKTVRIRDLQINPAEPLCGEMPSEFTILVDKGRWFICFTVPFEVSVNNNKNFISLDPGVRTFLTGFDGENILEIGNSSISKIVILCQRLDKLQSLIAQSSGRSNKRLRWKLRKQSEALRTRIRNLTNEVHNKASVVLTKNYKHIFLPTFETSKMVVKKKRKITSKTARNMLSWSHYRFKQTLKFHALKRGCVIHDVTEEYTSKTCSKCGHVHEKLGGNKKFKCPGCGHSLPRDWNGAINIFIKSLNDLTNASTSVEAGEDVPQYTVEISTCC